MKSLAIVIPAYKSTFLKETLESIASQTITDFTLYVGDDCSPNEIQTIVNEFRNRIDIVYHRFDYNLGGVDLVGQWERCIALTNGEPYIWLFSDDDIMAPNCVETFTRHITSHTDELLHFNIQMIDTLHGNTIRSFPQFPSNMTAGEFLEAKLCGNVVSFVVEFIFSRRLYNKVGGFENFDLAWGSDFMTWLKMAVKCKSGITTISAGCDSCVYWRKSSENISPNQSYPILIRKIKSLIANAKYIKDLFIKDSNSLKPLNLSFRWLRFPLGEIHRNHKVISYKDILLLCNSYIKIIGYVQFVIPILVYSLIKKFGNK